MIKAGLNLGFLSGMVSRSMAQPWLLLIFFAIRSAQDSVYFHILQMFVQIFIETTRT